MPLKPVKVGNVTIDFPITIPSGIVTTTSDIIHKFASDFDGVGFLTTKSIGVQPREGHITPSIGEYTLSSTTNSVGLTNPGVDNMVAELKDIYPLPNGKKLIASILGKDKEEFVEVAKKIVFYCDIIEANYSCPHAKGYGAEIFGCNPDLVTNVTSALKKAVKVPVMPKLTPNIVDIKPIVQACLDAGADAITAVNTVQPQLWTDSDGNVILSNGKGGLSGPTIFPITKKYIKDIAEVVKGRVPINACGGIQSANDIRELQKLGANMFGIGSALTNLPSMSSEHIQKFFYSLKSDLMDNTDVAKDMYEPHLNFDYQTFNVTDIQKIGDDLILITFDKRLQNKPGQFVFTWLPSPERNRAEKPFSTVRSDPLTILVRKIGNHTSHLYNLNVGDSVKVRGPYGNSFPIIQNKPYFLVGGGTGIAPIAFLAKRLSELDNKPTTFYGCSDASQIALKDELEKYSSKLNIATDNGSYGYKGFVTNYLEEQIAGFPDEAIVCICGPEIMAKKIVEIIERHRPKWKIYISIERYTKCGMGICGSCAIDGKRACVDGPIFELTQLRGGDFGRATRDKYGGKVIR